MQTEKVTSIFQKRIRTREKQRHKCDPASLLKVNRFWSFWGPDVLSQTRFSAANSHTGNKHACYRPLQGIPLWPAPLSHHPGRRVTGVFSTRHTPRGFTLYFTCSLIFGSCKDGVKTRWERFSGRRVPSLLWWFSYTPAVLHPPQKPQPQNEGGAD